MKTLVMFLLLSLHAPRDTSATVYVCAGTKGKKYHLRSDCRGLSHCSHRLIKMKLSDAQKKGWTLCGFEK